MFRFEVFARKHVPCCLHFVAMFVFPHGSCQLQACEKDAMLLHTQSHVYTLYWRKSVIIAIHKTVILSPRMGGPSCQVKNCAPKRQEVTVASRSFVIAANVIRVAICKLRADLSPASSVLVASCYHRTTRIMHKLILNCNWVSVWLHLCTHYMK
jgi:hypothetical protein